jgi:hypothetical protein
MTERMPGRDAVIAHNGFSSQHRADGVPAGRHYCIGKLSEYTMTRARLAALVTLLALVVQLSGCATPGGTSDAGNRTPAYADGYKDGCASGRVSQGSMFDFERRNTSRFDSDKQYAQGWTDAFQKCAYEQSQRTAAGR